MIALSAWKSGDYTESLFRGRTSVYEEYIVCLHVFVISVPKFQKMN